MRSPAGQINRRRIDRGNGRAYAFGPISGGHFAPIAIGLTLTVIHLVSIPVTNTSVNPARSTGPALFVGGWALGQLWLFCVAPLLGAAIAGVVFRLLWDETAPALEQPRIATDGT